MIPRRPPRRLVHRQSAFLLWAPLASLPGTARAAVPAAPAEPAVQLSAFAVTADPNDSYQALNTASLTGTYTLVNAGANYEAGATGTADCVLMSHDNTELVIVDLKTGRGYEVDATENSQLMMYASGALEYVSLLGFVPESVRVVIVQPRVSLTPSEWTCSVADLVAFGERVRQAAAAYGTGQPTPGAAQCRWCARSSPASPPPTSRASSIAT